MTDTGNTPITAPGEPPRTPPREPPNVWLSLLMVLIGIVLLLPGLCALIFGALSISNLNDAAGFMPFILIGLLSGFGGIMLIRSVVRRHRR
jgi:uncharacterized RDD family membrane protein YckC